MPSSVDIEILRIVILSLAFVIAVALIVFGVVGVAWRNTVGNFSIFAHGNFLRLSTVVFCVFAVVVLACVNKLTAEGAAAVISGIAGYVLGGVTKGDTSPSGKKNGDS